MYTIKIIDSLNKRYYMLIRKKTTHKINRNILGEMKLLIT